VGLSDVAPGVRAACDLLLDAGPTSGVSSTVLDLSGLQAGRGFRVLRPGAVGTAEIAAILAS
jgi:tRNA A37 threonylcarbamoyladenosine synthetase subunit TsaC/SUA5/YrdC